MEGFGSVSAAAPEIRRRRYPGASDSGGWLGVILVSKINAESFPARVDDLAQLFRLA